MLIAFLLEFITHGWTLWKKKAIRAPWICRRSEMISIFKQTFSGLLIEFRKYCLSFLRNGD